MTVKLNHKIDGSGPHVVLLHPVGLDLTFFEPLVKDLARDFTVLRADMRGHGKTAGEPRPASLEDFADDIHALLQETHFAPAAIAGFSFGGMLAQTLAIRYPQDVSALLPCACPCTMADDRRALSAARGTDALRDGMDSILDVTMERWFNDDFRHAGGDQPARKRLLSNDIAAWAATWKTMSRLDTLPLLGEITAPTLCIAGEIDKSSGPPHVKQIADAIPGARFTVMTNAPHMLFIEQPEETARLIREFLKEVCRPNHRWRCSTIELDRLDRPPASLRLSPPKRRPILARTWIPACAGMGGACFSWLPRPERRSAIRPRSAPGFSHCRCA